MKVNKNNKQKNETQPTKTTNTTKNFFERNEKTFLWISLAISALMSILMFDAKASLSGDDSDYVLYADKFCQNFTFPGFRGPLYPIILSPFVAIFGVNLVLLKSLSAIFILLSIWLLYKSFSGKIPSIILVPTLLILSVCSHVFFYASYTYSEPFFMFIQALFIYFFSRYFLNSEEQQYTLKKDWRKYLILGSIVLALGLTRSIGFGVLGAVILYCTIKSRWRDMLYIITATVSVFILFQIFKSIVWADAGSAYDIKYYLAKNYYNLNQGMEDFVGFASRFVQNSSIYLTKFFCKFIGFIPYSTEVLAPTVSSEWKLVFPPTPNIPAMDFISAGKSLFITIIVYVVFALCLISVFKKDKAILFVGIYIAVMNFASFIILQGNWQQDRLIMIYYPYMLLFLIGGLFYMFGRKKTTKHFVYFTILGIMLFGNLIQSKTQINSNLPSLKRNIAGDKLAGLTPDWRNFVLMSQWAAKNTDKNDVIVSRKSSISYIYTGRQFFGISSVPTLPVDSLPTVAPEGKQILIADASLKQMIPLSPDLQYAIIGELEVNNKKTNLVHIYYINSDEIEDFVKEMNENDIACTTDIDGFLSYCHNFQTKVNIHNPDALLKNLKDNNVKYVLLPSLRVNPNVASGNILNTLNRYLLIISMKYPDRFKLIHKIGETEPCELVEYMENGVE